MDNTLTLVSLGAVLLIMIAVVLWLLGRAQQSHGKQKFIILRHLGREVRAKVLDENTTHYRVVTMDDQDDGAVDLRVKKNDRRIIRIYEK